MDINSKLGIAIDLCNNGRYGKFRFTFAYPFTTENINAYIDMFDLKDRSLLTVGSSGDQVFNAILKGSNDITLYDVCPFAREYFYLKKAAILNMDRDEFFAFFCYKHYPKMFTKNRKTFTENEFYNLLEYIDAENPEVSYFWKELLKRYKGKFLRKSLFVSDEYNRTMLKEMDCYLVNDDNYDMLRTKMKDANVKFVYDNLYSISNKRKYDNIKYDNIFLSNVAAYYKLDDFKKLFDIVSELLTEDGKMLVAYLYDTDYDYDYSAFEDEIYNLPLVFKTFPKGIELTSFVGNNGLQCHDKKMKDSVLTYKKVKKI